jgi:hypothetical protein
VGASLVGGVPPSQTPPARPVQVEPFSGSKRGPRRSTGLDGAGPAAHRNPPCTTDLWRILGPFRDLFFATPWPKRRKPLYRVASRARPRGFEPLTFGSVDRGKQAGGDTFAPLRPAGLVPCAGLVDLGTEFGIDPDPGPPPPGGAAHRLTTLGEAPSVRYGSRAGPSAAGDEASVRSARAEAAITKVRRGNGLEPSSISDRS